MFGATLSLVPCPSLEIVAVWMMSVEEVPCSFDVGFQGNQMPCASWMSKTYKCKEDP